MKKIGRNEKCLCGSGKKFKICCLNNIEREKARQIDLYDNGCEIESEELKDVMELLKEEYADHKIINLSNVLIEDNYKIIQTRHYYANVIMIAKRNKENESVFLKRAPGKQNIMVLYRGAYQCFDHEDILVAMEKVLEMIDKRKVGENYTG